MPVLTRRKSHLNSDNVNENGGSLKYDGESLLHSVIRAKLEKTPEPVIKFETSDFKSKSSYEKRREENLRANAEFLASLNIKETKESFAVRNPVKESVNKPSKRGIKSDVHFPLEQREYQLRPREGLNLRTKTFVEEFSYSSEPAIKKTVKRNSDIGSSIRGNDVISNLDKDDDGMWSQNLELDLTWPDVVVNKESANLKMLSSSITQSCDTKASKYSHSLEDFISTCQKMTISEKLVAKVTPKRIFSLTVHPYVSEATLVAAGDKWGYIGIWNVVSGGVHCQITDEESDKTDDGVSLFRPHTRPVNCLEFSPYDRHIFYSCGYDGTVRRCDMTKQVFSLVYNTVEEDDIGLMYLDYADQNTVAIAQTDGFVSYVDDRTDKPISYPLKAGKLKAIHHHPLNRHYFLTGSMQGRIELWDNRFLSTDPKANKSLATLASSKGVLSAYFSPITGSKILSCTADDAIRIYDSQNPSSPQLQKTISHNNWTGRWLTNFRAPWHPAREDCFLIGAMKHPRQIEMFDLSGQVIHRFADENQHMSSVTSLNVFHPSQPTVVGGNSSGRVFVFKA